MLRVGIDKFSFNKFLDRYIFGEIYLDWKKNCKILRLKSFINKFFKVFLFWMVIYKEDDINMLMIFFILGIDEMFYMVGIFRLM